MKRIPNPQRHTLGRVKEIDFEDMWFVLKGILISQADPHQRMITQDIKTLNFVLEEMNRLEDMIRER